MDFQPSANLELYPDNITTMLTMRQRTAGRLHKDARKGTAKKHARAEREQKAASRSHKAGKKPRAKTTVKAEIRLDIDEDEFTEKQARAEIAETNRLEEEDQRFNEEYSSWVEGERRQHRQSARCLRCDRLGHRARECYVEPSYDICDLDTPEWFDEPVDDSLRPERARELRQSVHRRAAREAAEEAQELQVVREEQIRLVRQLLVLRLQLATRRAEPARLARLAREARMARNPCPRCRIHGQPCVQCRRAFEDGRREKQYRRLDGLARGQDTVDRHHAISQLFHSQDQDAEQTQQKNNDDGNARTANRTTPTGRRQPLRCSICDRVGHHARECQVGPYYLIHDSYTPVWFDGSDYWYYYVPLWTNRANCWSYSIPVRTDGSSYWCYA